MIVTQQQLGGGGEHAARPFAGDVHVPDDLAVGHRGTRWGNGDDRAGDRVRSAGDDLLRSPAEIDLVDPKRIARLRVRLLLEHPADHDL